MIAADAVLVARVIDSDDRAAFAELVHRHQSAVRRFLRSLTQGDHALADDLAQETFVQAYRALNRFGGRSSLETWLLGIAHNYWRNARRRQRSIPLEPSHLESEAAPSGARASDLQHDLGVAMKALGQDERAVLHLCYQQGLSHSEAADVLGWPVGTVKTHVARSKDKLRPLLAAWNTQT